MNRITNKMKYFYAFDVEGKGHFPIDMLRHDQCFPMSELDSRVIENYDAVRGIRTVRLCAVSHVGWQPTDGRWDSFGWHVMNFGEV